MSILTMALGSSIGAHPLGNRNLSPQAVWHRDAKKGKPALTPEQWALQMPLPAPTNVRPEGTAAPVNTPGRALAAGRARIGGIPPVPAMGMPPQAAALMMPAQEPKAAIPAQGAMTGGGGLQPIMEQGNQQPYGMNLPIDLRQLLYALR